MDEYYMQLLEVIKKYDPEEYKGLMSSYTGVVEDHLETLAEQFPNIEDFEKAMQKTAEELEKESK